MSHWFHRNPIKATAPVDFVKRSFPSSSDANTVCSLLRKHRENLLSLQNDPANKPELVQAEFQTYISLLLGFINDYSEKSTGESKIRFTIKSKWTQSLGPTSIFEEQDAVYELASITINNALWLTKHAAYVAAVATEPSEKHAKEIHKSLKVAAGQFKFAQENLIGKLIKSNENRFLNFFDITDAVLSTYVNQSKAEAQEITIARAIDLKHPPSLICSIAKSTSVLFQSAADGLKSLDQDACKKWGQYLALKSRFYKAYAYCYFGQQLLDSDKCGDAIKCLQDARKYYQETEELCKLYARTTGPGTRAIPERHKFFINLGVLINRIAEKCERENGMIYRQKVALEIPVMEEKATHGLAEPEEYVYPNKHELWTASTYEAFHIFKAVEAKEKNKNDTKTNVPAPREVPIPQGNAEPGTISGCSIS